MEVGLGARLPRGVTRRGKIRARPQSGHERQRDSILRARASASKTRDRTLIYNDRMHGGMVESMLTQEGGICLICRGAKHIACTSCEGSGKRDFAENYICD